MKDLSCNGFTEYGLKGTNIQKLMTEKEKMLAGQQYSSRDPELLVLYHKARKLFQEYNRIESTQTTRSE